MFQTTNQWILYHHLPPSTTIYHLYQALPARSFSDLLWQLLWILPMFLVGTSPKNLPFTKARFTRLSLHLVKHESCPMILPQPKVLPDIVPAEQGVNWELLKNMFSSDPLSHHAPYFTLDLTDSNINWMVSCYLHCVFGPPSSKTVTHIHMSAVPRSKHGLWIRDSFGWAY